ncbi:hypothetical protein KGF56_002396 [Candida oxycetoniae]|uniref:ER membrane protein complex subunit 3 n=1 Tax=Candida oxycetoniae TaxID=497107 RepID=A0AAI9SXW8_9ASCO|nr:uncharacterized protein KGF56_002396 [Candida oxycetoniae]KAI3404766.1 hypothetical protein KGF56_002396 [Candida oxycetoniae]
MVVVGLLRSNVTFLMQPVPKLESFKKVRESQFLYKARCFRENQHVLIREDFKSMRDYLVETLNSDKFLADPDKKDEQINPLDPSQNDALMQMAKGNLLNYIPQTLIMGWVNYFFAGFVIMKLPFPLPDGFKSMLQSGVRTPNLNVRYVSSISWYFVNLFGLRPVYSLIMGKKEAEELIAQQSQQQMQMPSLGGPGGPKAEKMFRAEAENIQILTHESVFDDIFNRFVKANA